MEKPVKSTQNQRLLVVAHDDKVLQNLGASISSYSVAADLCNNFNTAESLALAIPFSGILVDLATMIKLKAEEKVIAHIMTTIYPTIRIKSMGNIMIPMAMAGDAKQDKNIADFITVTTARYHPRCLRSYRRKSLCIPTLIAGEHGFTLDISWGGAFIADMKPERFCIDYELKVNLPDFGFDVPVKIVRMQGWGEHRPPGIGVRFLDSWPEFEAELFGLLRCDKNKDHDRLVI